MMDKKNRMPKQITLFNMLNFRKQSAARFTSHQRLNPATGKLDTSFDIQNDAGYGFNDASE